MNPQLSVKEAASEEVGRRCWKVWGSPQQSAVSWDTSIQSIKYLLRNSRPWDLGVHGTKSWKTMCPRSTAGSLSYRSWGDTEGMWTRKTHAQIYISCEFFQCLCVVEFVEIKTWWRKGIGLTLLSVLYSQVSSSSESVANWAQLEAASQTNCFVLWWWRVLLMSQFNIQYFFPRVGINSWNILKLVSESKKTITSDY